MERIIGFMMVVLVTVFLGSYLVYVPVILYTGQECLAQGYPKSAVTIGLDRYCIKLEGSTEIVVIKQ